MKRVPATDEAEKKRKLNICSELAAAYCSSVGLSEREEDRAHQVAADPGHCRREGRSGGAGWERAYLAFERVDHWLHPSPYAPEKEQKR